MHYYLKLLINKLKLTREEIKWIYLKLKKKPMIENIFIIATTLIIVKKIIILIILINILSLLYILKLIISEKKIEIRKDDTNLILTIINSYLIKNTYIISYLIDRKGKINDKLDLITFIVIRWIMIILFKFNITALRLSIKIWDAFREEFKKKNLKKKKLKKEIFIEYVFKSIIRINKEESEVYELKLLQINEFKIFNKIINIKIKKN